MLWNDTSTILVGLSKLDEWLLVILFSADTLLFVPPHAAQMPPLKPPTTWTSAALKELKAKLRTEKDSVVTVYRGDIMTVHVPTVPEAKKVCWEFATDGYDIGFGIYFDWTPVTSRSITVHISESSDDEDEEEELEGQCMQLRIWSSLYLVNSHLGMFLTFSLSVVVKFHSLKHISQPVFLQLGNEALCWLCGLCDFRARQ